MTRPATRNSMALRADRSCSVLRIASAACVSAAATRSFDCRSASRLAMMALPITMYSISNPKPIRKFANEDQALSGMLWGENHKYIISTTMPASIINVAHADQRSRSSNIAFGSSLSFLWPKAEGPYAYLIRRRKRRLILFAVFVAAIILVANFVL